MLIRLNVRDKTKMLARILEDEEQPELSVEKVDYPTKAKPYGLVMLKTGHRILVFAEAYSVRDPQDPENELGRCKKFSELLYALGLVFSDPGL